MSELWQLSAHEAADALGRREVSSEELTKSVIERISAVEGELRSFITPSHESALAEARRVDELLSAGEPPSPVAGVPVALKDIFVTKGIRSTAGSRILESYIPPYSSTVADRCARAGLPMLGKTNLDEFAMGSSTENSAYFNTRNPWDLERVPGGSSGGSAAAVAAGQAPWALGTDTGGSIRQPAALCGVVGFKPTYGRISRYGMIAFASSLDQAGPFTRTVRDAALMMNILAGPDAKDATCLEEQPPDYLDGLEGGVEGLRIGIVREVSGEGVQPGVKSKFDETVAVLEKLGAEVGEVSLRSFEFGIDVYYLIAPAEASANLARFDGVRYGLRVPGGTVEEMNAATRGKGFGPEVKRRIMLGTYSLSAGYYDEYYGKALKARTLIAQDFARAYESFDLLISPTSPTTAFRFGEKTDDPLTMYLSDVCTVPTSLAGQVAISVPCGLAAEDGLPVGFQIMGKSLDEPTVLRAAYAVEQEIGTFTPPSWGPA